MALIDTSSQYLALAPLAGFPEVTAAAKPRRLKQLAARFLAWRARTLAVYRCGSQQGANPQDRADVGQPGMSVHVQLLH